MSIINSTDITVETLARHVLLDMTTEPKEFELAQHLEHAVVEKSQLLELVDKLREAAAPMASALRAIKRGETVEAKDIDDLLFDWQMARFDAEELCGGQA